MRLAEEVGPGDGGVKLGLTGPRWEGTESPVAASFTNVSEEDSRSLQDGSPMVDSPVSYNFCTFCLSGVCC